MVESTVVSLNGTIKSEEMNEEGKLVSEKASRNQAPVGTWKYYWPDGKTVKIKEEYENGLLNGTRLVYYQNGEKQVDETYQFGMVTGLVKNYYEDGKLLSESYYRGNRQHSLYTSYYPNGKIKEQGDWV